MTGGKVLGDWWDRIFSYLSGDGASLQRFGGTELVILRG